MVLVMKQILVLERPGVAVLIIVRLKVLASTGVVALLQPLMSTAVMAHAITERPAVIAWMIAVVALLALQATNTIILIVVMVMFTGLTSAVTVKIRKRIVIMVV